MSKVLVTEGNLQDIASAIRSKNQGTDTYRPGDMAAAILAIPVGGTLVNKTITQNGEYDPEDDNADGYSDVTVNVPNSYSVEDEGKVVSSGALVAQTGLSVTQNGTYDTTENNEIVVNVSGGTINLQSKTVTQNGTVTPDAGYDGLSSVVVNVSGGGPVLPPEYQEVEYVECYGAQYILYSDIKLYKGDVIHAHASIDSSVSANTELGIIGGNASSTFDIYFLNNEIVYYQNISGTKITNVQRDTKYELNGTMIAAANNLCIGRYHSSYWHKGKIWRVTIEDGRNINTGNVVFRDFVPCYRKSDDEIGFYELVTGTFFPNAGTGAFGKGPDVT